jgi:hypothetical protein
MQLSELLLWVPIVSLLLCVPFVCYKDYKYREVSHEFWKPLVMFNLPVYAFMLISGVYELWMMAISAMVILFAFGAMKKHLIEGADFMFIMWIAAFFVIEPRTGVSGIAAPFLIFLIAITVSTSLVVKIINTVAGQKALEAEMFPMMFPISAALILTVILV